MPLRPELGLGDQGHVGDEARAELGFRPPRPLSSPDACVCRGLAPHHPL